MIRGEMHSGDHPDASRCSRSRRDEPRFGNDREKSGVESGHADADGVPNASIVSDRTPLTASESCAKEGQPRIVSSIADSAAQSAASFAEDALPILVSSAAARNTPATSAAMSMIASSAAARAKPLRDVIGSDF